MPSLTITNIRTVNQNGENATLFQPFSDALTLVMDISASSDLILEQGWDQIAIFPLFEATFQIIDPTTDTVLVQQSWTHALEWGPTFWISMGNNWGQANDWTTPEQWGALNGIFGFRGLIKAFMARPFGMQPLDAFDVSPIRWFRVAELAVG